MKASQHADAGEPYRYKAFLSYSHNDARWARWLHRRLETARIDKDLIGRETPRGPVPPSLRPVFLDRHDFSAGPRLSDQTKAALGASEALIVLCSPAAAQSHYVNEEIRLFKANRRDRSIIPFVIAGEPDNKVQDPFPPALKYQVEQDGTVTDRKEDLLGADARKGRDGQALAVAKLMAGLLALDTDDIFRRARRRTVRRRLAASLLLACMAGLAVASLYFADESSQKQKSLADIEAIVSQYTLTSAVNAQDTNSRRSLTEAVQVIADGARTDLRYQQALDLLKSGNIEKAEPILQSVADEKAARLQRDRSEAAAAYRHLGAIAGIANPERSRIAYGKALELSPDDTDALYWYGFLQLIAGHVEKSAAALVRLQTMAEQRSENTSLFRAHLRLGEIALLQGNVRSGLEHQAKAAAIARRVLSEKPGDRTWRRDHAVSLEKTGDLKSVQRRLASALADYKAALEIRQELLAEEPDNAELMRELAISYDKLGIAQQSRDQLAAAQEAFMRAYRIRHALIGRDANNATWQRDFAAALERNGDVKAGARRYQEALDDYRASFAIRQMLATRDADSYEAQRELSVAYNKLGDAERDLGDAASSLQHYRNAFAIRERLAVVDPTNKQRQVDLALSFARVADTTASIGDRAEALRLYGLGRERLANNVLGTENWVWQGYLREFDGAIAKLGM